MTPPEPVKLMPLRGPLGVREVFVTRRSAPILKCIPAPPHKPWATIISFVALLPVAWFYIYLGDHLDVVLGLQITAWIGLELGCLLGGLGMLWLASPAERRRRLAELAMTELRPVEIAQWFIARHVWPYLPTLTILTIGIALIHVCRFPDRPESAIPILLIGANMWVTLCMMRWMQFTILVSSQSIVRSLWRQMMFFLVYFLIVFWLVMVWLGLSFLSHPNLGISGFDLVLLVPIVVPFWWIKYRLARAWAQHLERAVFHRIEL